MPIARFTPAERNSERSVKYKEFRRPLWSAVDQTVRARLNAFKSGVAL